MTDSSICSIASSILGVFQQVIDAFFSIFSFLGIDSPNISSTILSLLNCSA